MCVCLVSLYFPSLELGQVFTPSQLSHSDVDAVLNSWLTLLSKLFSLSPGLPFPDLQLGKSGANSPISLRNPISVYICCVNTILSSWNDLGFYWRCFQKKKKMIKKYSCEFTMGYSGDCFKTSDKIENLATSHSCGELFPLLELETGTCWVKVTSEGSWDFYAGLHIIPIHKSEGFFS